MLQNKNSLPYCFQPAEQPNPKGQWFADMVNDWNKRTGKNLLVEIYDERQRRQIETGEQKTAFVSLADELKPDLRTTEQ
jgi:hypothetical protein